MQQQIKWTEREFKFGYPKGYAPLFLERLKMTAPRLNELCDGCSDAKVSVRRGDSWSVKEHIGHLSDLEILHDGRIADFIAGRATLRAADMSNQATYAAEHNAQPVEDLIAHLRKVRAAFIERVEVLDDRHFDHRAMHPRLQQQVTLTDMLFFIAEHDMHHLSRIAGLLGKPQ